MQEPNGWAIKPRFPGSGKFKETKVAVKKTVKKTETKATVKADKAVEKAAVATQTDSAKNTGAKKTVAKKAAVKKTTARKAAALPAEKPAKPGKVLRVVVGADKKADVPKPKGKSVKFKTDESTGRPLLPKGYKPSADEEYMNPLQLEYFRQKLVARREELVEESKQTIENLKDEVRDIGDEAERASRETENALELRTRDRYRKLISKIDSVIRRVDEGDYGYCVDSGEEIGLERLEARPEAERTIDAQERWEIRRKQQGD